MTSSALEIITSPYGSGRSDIPPSTLTTPYRGDTAPVRDGRRSTPPFLNAAASTPCQTAADSDLWFAEHTTEVERAKELCHQCPLRKACLASALERREPWGVWGGEVFVNGAVVARKRGRGRPRKDGTDTPAR